MTPFSSTYKRKNKHTVIKGLLELTFSRAFHKMSSECFSKGSKLYLIDEENKTGSCGIIEICDLRSLSPILDISIPSIVIDPSITASLNMETTTELFPAPVRPTIPTSKLKIKFADKECG